MITSSFTYFNKIASALGSKYLACNIMSGTARRLACAMPKYTIESKLITWIVEGVPSNAFRLDRTVAPDVRHMNDILEFVDDEVVKKTVQDYYHLSVSLHHLTYVTEPKLSKAQQDRCNILLRIIWYTLYE